MDHRGQGPAGPVAPASPARRGAPFKKKPSLLGQLEGLIRRCASAFPSPESLARGRRHLLSQLVCFGRHTISGLLRSQGRTQRDWTADYRFYSEDRFDEDQLFGQARREIEELRPPKEPLAAAMDDSLLRKTGRKIYGCRYQRDPLSPPFHVNFVKGLRVLQISAALPQGSEGAARLIPIDFQHAALPAKPRKDAGPEQQALYLA